MPAVPKVEVDMASFYDALRRYEKVRRKTTDDCMWRQVRNWCIKTLNWLKREPKPQIPVFPTDKSGPNWPLVSWLAKQRGEYLGQRRVAYVRGRPETKAKKRRRVRHPLLKLSKKQKSARNKAVGFLRAMMIAAAAAARNRRAEQSDSGIKAIASGGTDFAQKSLAAVSVGYGYKTRRTSAMKPVMGRLAEYKLYYALSLAMPAVVKDMEDYMARELEKAAAKEGIKA